MKFATLTNFLTISLLLSASTHSANASIRLDDITLPPGFSIEIYAQVPDARAMALDPQTGTLFVGTRKSTVYAINKQNSSNSNDPKVIRLLSGLNAPHGVAVHDGLLYVAEQDKVSRYEITNTSKPSDWRKRREVIYSNLPDESHHGTRDIAFGPDEKLYVAVGSPCNICMPKGIEDAIIRIQPDGSNMQVFARGIRNSVGLDFNPRTNVLYFTDNGADWMGDNSPPGELNAAPVQGKHYGFPYYGGGTARTREFANTQPPAESVPPVIEFAAHTASLGLHFYTGDQFPEEYRHDAFVAQHGSWNRSIPIGYRVMRVRFNEAGDAVGKQVFAEGWLRPNGKAWGRPVDILQLQDGSLLVSDDGADVIYRIRYDVDES